MGVQGRVLAQNRRARFEYKILKTFEVGIELKEDILIRLKHF